ncbi:MAG: cyanoexosortase A [Geitlerinemataceae cyanobacterium]
MYALKLARQPKYWLLAIAVSLLTIHLGLTWKTGDIKTLSISVIFLGATVSQIWDRKDTYTLESNLFATLFGTVILSLALFKTSQLSSGGPFLQALPFIFGLGLGLIASGARGLQQYWQELLAFFILSLPGERFLSHILESLMTFLTGEQLTTLTAKFSALFLGIFGFDVSLDGVFLILPKSVVKVYEGCSGASSIDFLLRLGLLFIIMFPTQRIGKILTPVLAILVGFFVNGVRVLIMAYLANTGDDKAFDYWHVGDGSQIFGAIAVLLFGGVCYLLIQKDDLDPSDPDANLPSAS